MLLCGFYYHISMHMNSRFVSVLPTYRLLYIIRNYGEENFKDTNSAHKLAICSLRHISKLPNRMRWCLVLKTRTRFINSLSIHRKHVVYNRLIIWLWWWWYPDFNNNYTVPLNMHKIIQTPADSPFCQDACLYCTRRCENARWVHRKCCIYCLFYLYVRINHKQVGSLGVLWKNTVFCFSLYRTVMEKVFTTAYGHIIRISFKVYMYKIVSYPLLSCPLPRLKRTNWFLRFYFYLNYVGNKLCRKKYFFFK